jgi:phosphoribosylamine--glycine ligase
MALRHVKILRVKVLVLGTGGREHALAWRLSQDPGVTEAIAAPGNPGMRSAARVVPVASLTPEALLELARREGVALTVVGPEALLDAGVVDVFRTAGLAILGPTRQSAQLECSKVFSKAFMSRHRVPTARFKVCESAEDAFATLRADDFGLPVVLKADGLAAGKGVIVATTQEDAEAAVRAVMQDRQFGDAGRRLVIEECLTGPEVSFFVLSDGDRAVPLGTAQDHKRIWDDDRGPNTGGMGAFAPSTLVDQALATRVISTIVDPVLQGMKQEGSPFVGFLYAGLMLTPEGPKVIEFNVRFGDPEAQVVLPQLEGNLTAALLDAANGQLPPRALTTSSERTVGVVLASRGYPASAESGQPISGLDEAAAVPGALVFHAGTREQGGRIQTAGGRVLTVVGRGATFGEAMASAYAAVERISFDGMQFRRDIGRKAMSVDSEVRA